ncbi:hypothetical protein BCR44DRAFT_1011381 [Catenaria anguillulae PL171]|uniref:Uncharacterized protein n=1 Tax=Catenaria anguillulae PL171 TaxID=765915 RepID=A0A1Y2I481_9FUNG|nr:hypothetical protein BCR44DRAFT_1011381 [Catenaria anguillulae PL171]
MVRRNALHAKSSSDYQGWRQTLVAAICDLEVLFHSGRIGQQHECQRLLLLNGCAHGDLWSIVCIIEDVERERKMLRVVPDCWCEPRLEPEVGNVAGFRCVGGKPIGDDERFKVGRDENAWVSRRLVQFVSDQRRGGVAALFNGTSQLHRRLCRGGGRQIGEANDGSPLLICTAKKRVLTVTCVITFVDRSRPFVSVRYQNAALKWWKYTLTIDSQYDIEQTSLSTEKQASSPTVHSFPRPLLQPYAQRSQVYSSPNERLRYSRSPKTFHSNPPHRMSVIGGR